MRISFASDFHGNPDHYESYLRWIVHQKADLAILGGDNFRDGAPPDEVASQVRFVSEQLEPWLEQAYAARPGLIVAAINGNHDWLPTRHAMQKLHDDGRLVLLDHRPWVHRGTAFVGFSHTPPTPWYAKDFERLDLADDPPPEGEARAWDAVLEAAREVTPRDYFASVETLDTLLNGYTRPAPPWVFVCHAPPHDSPLDRLPNIPHPVGSRAVRAFIEMNQPLVSLHGHIHESPAVTGAYQFYIGRTLCLNPGQSADMHAISFDVRDPAGTLRHSVLT